VAFYLGIDGGGSKTTCAVGNESSVLATVTTGASNVVRVGEGQARESLHQAVRQACAAAGVIPAQIVSTSIGVAGVGGPEIAGIVSRCLAEILPTPIHVVGDMQIALEAAFDAGPGVVVIAGTGSIAYGRNQQGITARAGGWGFAVSDEGSAHWIGRAAIAAALRARDPIEAGRELSSDARTTARITENAPLLQALQKAWDVGSLDDLVRAANSTPTPDFALLFPAVVASAEAADGLGLEVLKRAGVELAQLAAVVVRRLFSEESSETHSAQSRSAGPVVVDLPVPTAMVGGVFRHSSVVRDVFYNQIQKVQPRVSVRPQVVDPVDGALRMARRAPSDQTGRQNQAAH
jgi:N-acetylglucosamine kinase-like BadF-type ATPase